MFHILWTFAQWPMRWFIGLTENHVETPADRAYSCGFEWIVTGLGRSHVRMFVGEDVPEALSRTS